MQKQPRTGSRIPPWDLWTLLTRSPTDPPAQRSGRPQADFALVAILLLALAFRVYRIDFPLVDAHSWRQVTNADIARHFMTGSLNPFTPRVSWGGPEGGVVGMEFPLLQWLTGVAWRVTGESELVARLVATAFSLATVWLMYLVGLRLHSRGAGRAAAALTAMSPGLVFFGRSFLSDTPMVTFMVASVLAWDRYFDRPDWTRAAVASAAVALAGLVKLPAILVLGGVAGLAWGRGGWRGIFDRRLMLGCAGALAATAAWYGYADLVYLETGLTQAVFRPSGTYPPDIAPGVDFVTVSHFSTAARLLSADYWWRMGDRLWSLYLTPVGTFAAIIGIGVACTRPKGWALHLWTLAGVALVLVAAEGQYQHEFHTLPLVPPLLLYAGLALAPVFEPLPGLPRAASVAVVSVAVAVISLQSFRASGVRDKLYRSQRPADAGFEEWGPAVRELTQDAPIITVDYLEGGANSPMMLYYAHRRGWSFDVHSISIEVIEHLVRTHGARYFVTADWLELAEKKPEVAAYLSRHRLLLLPPLGWNLRGFTIGD